MNTLSTAIAEFVDEGFTEYFGVRGDRLRDLESGTTFAAHDVVIRGFERFEGVSDPVRNVRRDAPGGCRGDD